MRGARRGVASGVPVVVLLAAATLSCTSTRQLTPWFRVESHRPLLDQPVEIGGRANDVAWMLIGGRWVQVADGEPFATRARDGRAVLFSRAGRWQIAHESGEILPLASDCAFPAFHPTMPAVYCARCANRPIAVDCEGTVLDELDFSGRVTRVLRSPEPSARGAFGTGLVALTPDGAIVLSTYGACRLFALGDGGTTVLASGPRRTRCTHFKDWADVLAPLGAVPLVRSEPSAR